MAFVVLLRGVNVGGHRTFRPSTLVAKLRHLDVVNIGAAGTFVVRRSVPVGQVRSEFARHLPFETEVLVCRGSEIAGIRSRDFFKAHPARPDIVRFLSVLARTPRSARSAPFEIPETGPWGVKVLAREGRFVVGLYRRQMQAIRHLGTLDRVFGAPVTTRNWNTVDAIADVLAAS